MVSALTRVLRLASIGICMIVLASFVLFVVNQTSTASAHQQEVVNGTAPSTVTGGVASAPKPAPSKPGAVHQTIDEASNALTSPFSGVTAGSTSQWTIRGANLLLALVVYGFGLGFVARLIRVGR